MDIITVALHTSWPSGKLACSFARTLVIYLNVLSTSVHIKGTH